MNKVRIGAVLQAAVAQGLLPVTATLPALDSRPWPVVLLTALGAWLAALPLLGVVGLLFGGALSRSAGLYIVGMLVLAGAIVVLRARDVPLFVEQLAVPALLIGGGSLGFGLFRDLHTQAGAIVLALVAVGVAWAIARPWLRVLLGAAAAVLLVVACMPVSRGDSNMTRYWFGWHASLAVWWVVGWIQRTRLGGAVQARNAAALESLGAGWLLATLAGLAGWSGMTFLAGASLGGGFAGDVARELGRRSIAGWDTTALQAASALLTAAAMLWAARHWPTLRRAWLAGVALVLMTLAWFMPTLGAVLLALAFCLTSTRWRLAGAAALAAAWIIGAFYYQLDWTLAAKSLVLIAAGAALGGLAWFAPRAAGATAPALRGAAAAPATCVSRAGIALSALAVLGVANLGIWQKEDLIAHGAPVYVELAPADPRSLMQGDFMRLNFRLPGGVQGRPDAGRPRVVAARDARGVATLLRIDEGAPLQAGELRIELTPKAGRWIVVTDAWFFKEGEANRWAAAKYGEFRVDPDGRALLVGLRGAKLESL